MVFLGTPANFARCGGGSLLLLQKDVFFITEAHCKISFVILAYLPI